MLKSDSSGTCLYKSAAEAQNPSDLVVHALPWVLEAGNPYYGGLFGSAEVAEKILDAWMRRPTSEISILRVQFMVYKQEFVGGFVALGAGELLKARKADGLALLGSVSLAERATLIKRMRNLSDLFPPVSADEYYLSKLGLLPHYRGKRLSRILVERYLEDGHKQGYTRYRLDVEANNQSAIRCYQSAGFQLCECNESKDRIFQYHIMRYEI